MKKNGLKEKKTISSHQEVRATDGSSYWDSTVLSISSIVT